MLSDQLTSKIDGYNGILPDDMEGVIDFEKNGYYLVSHSRRIILWLDVVEHDIVTGHYEWHALSMPHMRAYRAGWLNFRRH